MASKKVIQLSIMGGCVAVAALVFLLARGFELTIEPEQLEPGINARLPIEFRVATDTHIQWDGIAQQVMPRDCGELGAGGTTNIECRFRNVFLTPLRKTAALLPVVFEAILEKMDHVTAIPVTVERFEDVYMDSGGNIQATGYLSIHTPFTDQQLPVDITLKTRADTGAGLIELNSELAHEARDYLETWEAVLTLDTGLIAIPFNFSDPRLEFPDHEMSFDESSHYTIDLKRETLWFTFLQPFLKDIKLDQRGITLSYGL